MVSQEQDNIRREIQLLQKEVTDYVSNGANDGFRRKFFGQQSVFKQLVKRMTTLPLEDVREIGKSLHALRGMVKKRWSSLEKHPQKQESTEVTDDITLPPMVGVLGGLHPLTLLQEKMVSIFKAIGFRVAEGPEIEDEWHNFAALNFPPNHPARSMQDTFFIRSVEEDGSKMSLRSQTSSVQIRTMMAHKPPIRIMSTGRVFRKETISARSHCMFHQIEVLCVDSYINLRHLKGMISYFVRSLFGEDAVFRLRPSYFPFTEPSLEVDIQCLLCNKAGCAICKGSTWVEIGGAGMVDPNVLKNCNIDANRYSGFAFGMGLERIAMLRYGISDVRVFTTNDFRFSDQFTNLSFA